MAGKIEEWRAAGFSDDEIAGYAVEKRATLSAAGFRENEIDAYFVGSVTVPDTVPKAFADRFSEGAADQLDAVTKAMGSAATGRVFSAFAEGASAGWGEHPLGLSQEDVTKLQDSGVFAKPDEGYNLVSGIRFANEALIRPSYTALQAAFKGMNAAIYGVGAAAGQVIGEATGANEAEQARARRDGAQFATVATLLAGGHPVARTRRGPTGEPITETIGGLPKGEDFANAARVIGGEDAPMALQQKMLRLYEEQGIHPAELAADAARDPVLHQRLLSADAADVPYAKATVEGAGKEPPKPPGEPPPAPPEGSYEAAQAKVLDRISIGERTEKTFDVHTVYTQLIDELHPIKRLDDDAYMMARLTRGQFGKAEQFLERSTFDFNTLADTGKPLKEILAPVVDDIRGLRAYVSAKRALDIEASGRKTGVDLEAAQRTVGPEGAKYAKIAEELTDYQNRVLGYLKDSGVLSESSFAAMVEANKNYVPFYRVITPETAPGSKSLGTSNPVHRLKGSEREIVDPIESIIKNTYAYVSVAERNAAGIKIVEALEREGLKVTTERSKPKADADLADYLREQGVTRPDELTEFIRAGMPDDGTTLSAWRDGKKVSVKVDDPELVAAFRGLDRESLSVIWHAIGLPAKGLRAGTVIMPDFISRNLMRDLVTAFINSGKGVFSPIDSVKGLKSAITKDEHFQNWVKSGGANAEMVAIDRRYMQESLAELSGQTGLMQRGWNVVNSPIRALRLVSELAEQATRVGEFRKMAKDAVTKQDFLEAGFASREVTLDFARRGAQMRAFNMITAFLNPSIQGMDRVARGFKDRPVNTALKIAVGVTLPSVLLWWANHDDPRYQELPWWQKDLFWIIPTNKWESASAVDAQARPEHLRRQVGGEWQVNNGTIWRIPKPFEVGVAFGSGAERLLEATVAKNPDAFDGFAKSVWEMLWPNFTPTLLLPVVEQFANRSTFTDRTLIPAYLEKQVTTEYQYTPYTSETAKALGQMVAAFPGMEEAANKPGELGGGAARALTTPILIENYIRSWTGGMGMYALNIADAGLRKSGILPDPPKPADTLADIPFVKAFVVRYPSASAQSLQDFYDQHTLNSLRFSTWMNKAKEGDLAAMERVQAAGGPQMFLRLEGIKEVLGDHSKMIRDITKNPDIKSDEKRQLIDGVYWQMIQMARDGVTMMRAAKTVE